MDKEGVIMAPNSSKNIYPTTHISRHMLYSTTVFKYHNLPYIDMINEITSSPGWGELLDLFRSREKPTSEQISLYISKIISEHGVFARVHYNEHEAELYRYDPSTSLLLPAKNYLRWLIRRLLTKLDLSRQKLVSDAIENIEAYAQIDIKINHLNPFHYLPLQNWVLDLETLDRREYEELASQGIFFTKKVPVDLPDGALVEIKNTTDIDHIKYLMQKLAPNFYSLLSRFYEGENFERLVLSLGAILVPRPLRKPIVFVIGEPRTGKTTLLDAIISVLGDFISTTPLASLAGEFGLYPLLNKRANISEEKPGQNINSELLKQLSGGGYMTINIKHRPQFQALLNPTIISFMNHAPHFSDIDEALLDRIKIVYASNPLTKDETDPEFMSKLVEERVGILLFLILAYKLFKLKKYHIDQDLDEIYDTLILGKSNVGRFSNEVLIYQQGEKIKGKALYDLYLVWCGDNHLKPLGLRNFYDELAQAIRKKGGKRYTGHAGTVYFADISVNPSCPYGAPDDNEDHVETIKIGGETNGQK